ncbi:hypothetical protein U7230_07695 [Carboxydochorda subterranea]|uniref:Uncharacterized protein n=1 Tax=Carboxydichorda subterranea TaxID=3109565 RepID=A0ABZ1C1H6_9FIRM|nr:hypothetical protein [Limnochorda sp. L945t]WRP18863.1 hypothetical protein U7230_07695 [Limnochorda sp. L945t]
MERWRLAEIEADVVAASARLRELVPGIGRFSFAYPCGQSFVGKGPRRRSYEPVIARHFTVEGAGRAGQRPGYLPAAPAGGLGGERGRRSRGRGAG